MLRGQEELGFESCMLDAAPARNVSPALRLIFSTICRRNV
jgi:hypothetical protein